MGDVGEIIEQPASQAMHPVDYSRDILGVNLWSRQAEALDLVYYNDKVSIKSGHGVGKTMLDACAAVWFLNEYDPAIVITTAPSSRQVREILWPEIRKLWRRSPLCKLTGVVANLVDIRVSDDRRAFGFSTDDPQRLQGMHSPNIFVIVDEANGVLESLFDSISGVITSENAKLLMTGNPIVPEGRFFRSHMPGSGFAQMTISALENPNYVNNSNEIPGLTTRKWVEEQKIEWGEGSPAYKARVLGEFPESAEDTLITNAMLQSALDRGNEEWPDYDPGSAKMGVDVARFGSDRTVFCVRDKHGLRYIDAYQGRDLMYTVGRIRKLMAEYNVVAEAVAVDDTGLGSGVTDRLYELDINIVPVDFGMKAVEPWKFANIRAEMYWAMAQDMNPTAQPPGTLAIPPEYARVCAELIQPHYTFTSSEQIKLEPKKEIKKRLGRSPDYADALALTYAPLAPPMEIVRI